MTDKPKYWLTPPELLRSLEKEFGKFEMDPCPYPRPAWYDGLLDEWSDPCFVNPPFLVRDGGPIPKWLRKGVEEWKKGKTIIFLIPAMGYWKVLPDLNFGNVEVRMLGRMKFLGCKTQKVGENPPHDSILLILKGGK